MTLTSLLAATAYEYRVRGDGATWSGTRETRTAPAAGSGAIDFVYVADTGLIGRTDGLATGTQQVVNEIAALKPLLVLGGGDYAYFDTDKRYGTLNNTIDAWFNQIQPVAAASPLMPVYGNHEVLLGEGYDPWSARFATPTGIGGSNNRQNYSFDVGDVHFTAIMAVSDTAGLASSVLQWIDQDLQNARTAGKRWLIPYFHVPAFGDGGNHPENRTLRGQLAPIFERHGVKLAIASHDQAYERSYPLTNATSSGYTITSSSKTCYTLADGVTWVKTSPGGKRSNINGSFSSFRTSPAPSWTAFRDNTLHHFSRVAVKPSGILRLKTYGVKGDGSPPVVQDAFEYRSNGCPITPSALIQPEQHVAQHAAGRKPGIEGHDPLHEQLDRRELQRQRQRALADGRPGIRADTGQPDLDRRPSGLGPGTYSATVTARASGYTSATSAVTFTVTGSTGSGFSIYQRRREPHEPGAAGRPHGERKHLCVHLAGRVGHIARQVLSRQSQRDRDAAERREQPPLRLRRGHGVHRDAVQHYDPDERIAHNHGRDRSHERHDRAGERDFHRFELNRVAASREARSRTRTDDPFLTTDAWTARRCRRCLVLHAKRLHNSSFAESNNGQPQASHSILVFPRCSPGKGLYPLL